MKIQFQPAFPAWTLAIFMSLACAGSSGDAQEPDTASELPSATEQQASGPRHVSSFDPELGLDRQWTGDLDGMIEREHIRALVAYSKTGYFLDGASQRGLSYEALKEFEKFVNQRLGRGTLKVYVVIIPVSRDEIFPALVEGLGDLAAANLTITPERLEMVDFSMPALKNATEVVVTGPKAPSLDSLDDLAGKEIHVRRSSSYWASLETLNEDLRSRGLEAVRLVPAEEYLEDEDLLEMVNAGLLPMVVVDRHKAVFWEEVFDNLVVHDALAVRSGGQIAWAFRKGSPQLAEIVNAFIAKHKQGTLFGNVLLKRYLGSNPWVKNSLVDADRKRFDSMVGLFQRYGGQYDFDHLLLAAVAYQESRLDQSLSSRAGAVGVMQLLPTTAADPNVGIPNIEQLEANIHAGAKYLHFLHERYFSDPEIGPLDQRLFTFAAYNAGPASVRRLRDEAAREGFDPNRWFGNVERIAAKRIGRETVQYVSNITKYYIAYRLVVQQKERKAAAASNER